MTFKWFLCGQDKLKMHLFGTANQKEIFEMDYNLIHF